MITELFSTTICWGKVKDLVYRERPTTRDDMIRRIRDAIGSLDADEIFRDK